MIFIRIFCRLKLRDCSFVAVGILALSGGLFTVSSVAQETGEEITISALPNPAIYFFDYCFDNAAENGSALEGPKLDGKWQKIQDDMLTMHSIPSGTKAFLYDLNDRNQRLLLTYKVTKQEEERQPDVLQCRLTYENDYRPAAVRRHLIERFDGPGYQRHVGRYVDKIEGWHQYVWSRAGFTEGPNTKLQSGWTSLTALGLSSKSELIRVQLATKDFSPYKGFIELTYFYWRTD